MLPVNYQGLQFAVVKNTADLFKDTKLLGLKRLFDAARNLFKTGAPINLYICPTNPIYKIEILKKVNGKDIPVGELIYIPGERRLDIYDSGNLLLQWKGKSIAYSSFSPLLSSIKIENNFVQLYNLI